MKRTNREYLKVGMVLLASLMVPAVAGAVPAFARQMNTSCDTCHFQHFPLLNAFGRAFKASGFTMTSRKTIENDHFSLPENLNMALFTNIRYQSSNGPKGAANTARTSNNGEWIIPGETSLFLGGRVSANMGALVEGDVGGAGTGGSSPFLASIKLPFMYDVGKGINLGVVPFSAGLGPAYAFETMNTGAVGNHLINLVHPTAVSAQQYIQAGPATADYGGDSEGIGLVAVSSNFFVTLAKWSPNHLPIDTQGSSVAPSSDYARVAYMPQLDGWDLGFGLQYFGGHSSRADSTTTPVLTPMRTEAYAVDAQAQGMVGDMPLGIYLSYAAAPSTKAGQMTNLYDRNPNQAHAASLAVELGAFSGGLGTVQLAYRTANDGANAYNKDNAVTAGVTYLLTYNAQLALLETWYSGSAFDSSNPTPQPVDASGSGDRLTSVNLAVGF
ncbi:MAG: hypothetical protein P8164_12575 [Gammaproteobacteria bacterium]|jgi:hypothetical protein